MVKETKMDTGIDFESLGIAGVQEPDRMQLDTRGKMQIIKIRFDYKTKYWNEKEQKGTPITKFDGVDIVTGEIVKYFTLSSVIYKQMNDIIMAVGVSLRKDENGNEWSVLKDPINIKGFEKVSTGVKGQNPYLTIKTS